MFRVGSNPCRHLKGDIIVLFEDRKTCSVKLSDLPKGIVVVQLLSHV